MFQDKSRDAERIELWKSLSGKEIIQKRIKKKKNYIYIYKQIKNKKEEKRDRGDKRAYLNDQDALVDVCN